MLCPNCNNEISDKSLFCPFCREKVGEAPKPQQTDKQVVDHIDYIPYVQNNPLLNAEKNVYYNQQQNLHDQAAQVYYGTPGYESMREYAEYNKKATIMRNFGIIAAVLMFGIGFVFSIVIWIFKASTKAPRITPQNVQEQTLLEDAQKKLKTANILAFMPVIALVVCFILGFVLSASGIM